MQSNMENNNTDTDYLGYMVLLKKMVKVLGKNVIESNKPVSIKYQFGYDENIKMIALAMATLAQIRMGNSRIG